MFHIWRIRANQLVITSPKTHLQTDYRFLAFLSVGFRVLKLENYQTYRHFTDNRFIVCRLSDIYGFSGQNLQTKSGIFAFPSVCSLKALEKRGRRRGSLLKILFLLNRDPYSALVICYCGITVSIPLDICVAGEFVVRIAGKPLCEDLCVS